MAQPKTSTPASAWGQNPSSPSSSPWGTNKVCTATSFSDVMNEEYAKQLEEDDVREGEEEYLKQCKETEQLSLTTAAVEGYEVWEEEDETSSEQVSSGTDTDNDLLLAKLLQMEFDKENDQHIRKLEKNYNGSDKVSVSFKNYYSHQHFDPDAGEDDDDDENRYYESSDDTEEDYGEERKPTIKPKYGSEVITKHDSLITERKNTRKMEQFSSDFKAGDVDNKIRIPNHVFNKLKLYSEREQNRDVRLTEKQDHSTHERALDEYTRLILYKMVNNGTLDSLEGIIAMGKESVVIYSKVTPPEEDNVVEYAIKVYKTTLSEFKTREKYIKEDYRYKDRFQKQNPRKIIKLWAEKEFRNLQRMEEAGISCPKAVLLRKHVLLLSFIGTDGVPAPKLKDAHLNKTQLAQAYIEIITEMKKMYDVCNLIHADMSEYNVLWHQGHCVFIDVSQSVEPTHAQAFHFLYRDCKNISQFFTKSGVPNVMKEDELFRHVCGRDLAKISLDELENESKENFEGNEEMLCHGIDSKNFAFDYHFRQSLANKEKTEEEKTWSEED